MSEFLSQLSNDLSETVAKAGGSVVRVEGRRRLAASGFVWSTDGIVVTANHVLERDDNLKVGLPDGESVDAELVGRDSTTDLAALRADVAGAGPPALTEPDGLRVGNFALALGRPGRTVQATLGIVSALGEDWRTRAGGHIDRYLQTDVVMYPGFSGGPLVDALGNVAGLNTSALTRSVTVSVPVPTIRQVVETLVAYGKIRRGFLGVGAQVVKLPEGPEGQTDQETGLLVVSVDKKSPAQEGGILMGDTIVALDREPVRQLDDLLSRLTADSVGKAIPIRIVRGGEVQEVTVTVGERE